MAQNGTNGSKYATRHCRNNVHFIESFGRYKRAEVLFAFGLFSSYIGPVV